MKRLTTDNPQSNVETAWNLFYIKNHETWVRGGGPEPEYVDISLYDWARRIIEIHGLDIDTSDNDMLGYCLYERLFDCVDTMEGVVAHLYTAAWAYAELRERLSSYEDTGLEPDEVSKALTAMKSALGMACELQAYRDSGLTTGELAHAAELLRADKEGRCKIPSCGETVFVLTDACWWTTNLKREEIIECRVTTHRLTKKGDVKFSVDGFWESGHPYKASFGATSIGKTVFLARAEAEAALGGGGDG